MQGFVQQGVLPIVGASTHNGQSATNSFRNPWRNKQRRGGICPSKRLFSIVRVSRLPYVPHSDGIVPVNKLSLKNILCIPSLPAPISAGNVPVNWQLVAEKLIRVDNEDKNDGRGPPKSFMSTHEISVPKQEKKAKGPRLVPFPRHTQKRQHTN